jgi:hypothetical protein
MADLLGNKVNVLGDLETALLILSAHLHDIGMVFSTADRQGITSDEPHWSNFLRENPRAFLDMRSQEQPSLEVVEWYCRWRHAERVFTFLHSIPVTDLRWETSDLREVLGELCVSHVKPIEAVRDSDVLASSFRTDTDLKFLAIVLRLADILDFDRSRSPEGVYEYLGLSRRSDRRHHLSDVEWQKHLCSEGFIFPNERVRGYKLDFVAGPTAPAVEDDVRQFLAVIEDEFRQCSSLLPYCSERWRDFALPASIDRNNIKSNGYRFGQYRFTLDQRQVIALFSGENLYLDSPFVLLRELLQNAIDTTRHRVVAEEALGHAGFRPEPISIDHWVDEQGYQWLRVDDFGMGMDEPIIRQYLLRVGSSYYNSVQFQADLLRSGADPTITIRPISRFGIGLLSCFLEGDRIEISTLRINADGSRGVPVRLSISGDQGFYTLQTPHLDPTPFPAKNGPTPGSGYRTTFGTSIAVRLSPLKESSALNVSSLLQQWVLAPPVPVAYNNRLIGGQPSTVMDRPWSRRTSVLLTASQMAAISEFIGYPIDTPLIVELIPLNISKHSTSPNIRGQILITAIVENDDWYNMRMELGYQTRNSLHWMNEFETTVQSWISVDRSTHDICIVIERGIWKNDVLEKANERDLLHRGRLGGALKLWKDEWTRGDFKKQLAVPIPQLSQEIGAEVRDLMMSLGRSWDSERVWCHNGIWFPSKHCENQTEGGEYPRLVFDVVEREGQTVSHWGLVALCDDPRPDLSPARDRLLQAPWAIYSASSFAFCKALREEGFDERDRDRWHGDSGHTVGKKPRVLGNLLGHVVGQEECMLGNILKDPLMTSECWGKEPVIETDRGYRSVHEIEETLRSESEVRLLGPFDLNPMQKSQDFMSLCVAALIQRELRFRAEVEKRKYGKSVSLVAVQGRPFVILEGLLLFPPLAFVPLGSTEGLRIGHQINLDHEFAKWLLQAAPQMNRLCPGLLAIIRSHLWKWTWNADLREKAVDEINQIVARVLAIGVDVRPRKTPLVSREDFD